MLIQTKKLESVAICTKKIKEVKKIRMNILKKLMYKELIAPI